MPRARLHVFLVLALLPQVLVTFFPPGSFCFGCVFDGSGCCAAHEPAQTCCCCESKDAAAPEPCRDCPNCLRIDTPDRLAPVIARAKVDVSDGPVAVIPLSVADVPASWCTSPCFAPANLGASPPSLAGFRTTRLVL